ncbi:nucleoside-triphosphatase THEP1 [Thermosulfidibacter takaii ABI70S6]|uniref:Nucleoside-triphosphatase THEP1 n=1 Tax=Thermosulfidibacter takaii (strain DSM 17441 / JCM 13301 / NBRC 103674 / ABI70S6) TaxID=1298851 RepID=A0A0S3QVK9_THET7|nr:NTPase [Thermosulfidibacter takaii]BAT72360.1 nucleoside-triphosphatase THEP1 [Thermosulfidibacter takaii ABI70S6]
MKLFLTGKPGVGKTTAIIKVLELLQDKGVGFYTKEIREKGKRVGFKLVTTWGESYIFAHVDIDGPRVSRYGVDVRVLEHVIEKINGYSQEKFLIVDEIGKMEMLSGKFLRWVEKHLASHHPFIGTIPIRSRHPLVEKIRQRYNVWEVTPDNREAIPFRVLDLIK